MIPLMKPRVWMLALASVVTTAFASDISDLLAAARRAYSEGQIAVAKEKFDLVRRLEPTNSTALTYLKRIAADEILLNKGRNNTEEACKKLVLEKVDLRDASLAEALEFLKQKAVQASGGKLTVNFVLQLDEQAQTKKVTLTMQKAPFFEVLRYVGELVEVQFKYEQYAIVVKPKSVQAPPTVPAEPPGTVKIPGLDAPPRQ